MKDGFLHANDPFHDRWYVRDVPHHFTSDHAFVLVTAETALQDFIGHVDEKHQPIICLDDDGRPTAAFTVLDAIRHTSDRSKELDGMIALSEHKVAHLLDPIDIPLRWVQMAEKGHSAWPQRNCKSWAFGFWSATDPATGRVTGAIVRAHRGY